MEKDSSETPVVRPGWLHELWADLRGSNPGRIAGGFVMSAMCASMALSGAPAGLPGVAGLVFVVATGAAAVGCLGIIAEELGRSRDERLALMRADAEDVDALRYSIRRESEGSAPELDKGDGSPDP